MVRGLENLRDELRSQFDHRVGEIEALHSLMGTIRTEIEVGRARQDASPG
jgi:hypothetical protein